MAEILQEKGYRTAFITDVYHMFKPGMNFHRGFDEWRFIRGQEFDVYRSGAKGEIDIGKYLSSKMDKNRLPAKIMAHYLRNVELRQTEDDYFAPQVFSSAMRWLEENYRSDRFFLCIDCFDPHEPWDPPQYYRDMYDPGYTGTEIILPFYSENLDYMTDAELTHVRALYAAEVTMVDTWLGYFINKVEQLGLMEDTVIALFSDHGHLLGENGYMGKPPSGLYPGLMDLVFMIKAPGQQPKTIDSFVYDHDLFPTLFYLLGEDIPEQGEGGNLWDLVEGKKEKFRDYVTSILKTWLWARDDGYVMIRKTDGRVTKLYDIRSDPTCAVNIAGEKPEIVDKMYQYMLADADGDIPMYPDPRAW